MDEAPYLRRQVILCLNLAQSCSDAEKMTEHLEMMAAEFHARALKAEFQPAFDAVLSAHPISERDIENLYLLLSSSEVVEMFDETARKRIGEFISRAASQPETWLPFKRRTRPGMASATAQSAKASGEDRGSIAAGPFSGWLSRPVFASEVFGVPQSAGYWAEPAFGESTPGGSYCYLGLIFGDSAPRGLRSEPRWSKVEVFRRPG